jgi:hypothetical protein
MVGIHLSRRNLLKLGVLGLPTIGMVGCAALPKNELSSNDVKQFKLVGVDVVLAPNATITWFDAEQDYAGQKSRPTPAATEESEAEKEKRRKANEAVVKSPEARALIGSKLAARIKPAMEKELLPKLKGSRPVRASVSIKLLDVPSAVQRALLGGNNRIAADVVLLDEKGKAVTTPQSYDLFGGAAQGVVGVLIEQVMPDPLEKLTTLLAQRYSDWLLPTT